MSNLEHLIENTLVAMEDNKLCFNDICKRVQNDINLRYTSLSVDDVLEICQYVKYVWCRDLENRLNTQHKEAKRLLKEAVEGNNTLCMEYIACKGCPFDGESCNKWKHEDEALKLIGGIDNDD